MNNFIMRRHVFSILLIATMAAPVHAYFNFDDMEKHFQEMHESMEQSFDQIRKQMHDSFKNEMPHVPWKIDCTDSQDGKSLIVAVIGVATEDIKAQLSDDNMQMTVIMDNGTVGIKVSKNWVSISIKQSQESKKKSKKASMHSASISSKSTSRTVTHDLDLAEAKVDYSSKDKVLMITIPYRKETKRGRVVPVTIDAGIDDGVIDSEDGTQEVA